MAKITLGNRPKSFKRTLKVAMPEGGEGLIEVSYRYRTRSEFGAFVDGLMSDAGVKLKSESEEEVKFSLAEALSKTRDTNADYILKIIDGWGLDAEFNKANVVQLCDELPGVALAIINDYRLAITEGRSGN